MLQVAKGQLPSPNNLPRTFSSLISSLKEELIQVRKVQVCINNCNIYVDDTSKCPICSEDRYTTDNLGRKRSWKNFSYCLIGDSLQMMFGCKNIAQVIQSTGRNVKVLVGDIQESQAWENWMDETSANSVTIALGLNTDGVNPYHSAGQKYSFWPLIFTIMNLPKFIRCKPDALVLYGIIPGKFDHRDNSPVVPKMEAYQQLMVEELLSLCSTELYSAYSQAPIKVKVQLLAYMMDIQAYSKYFKMSGPTSYYPCMECKIKAQYIHGKMCLLNHENYHQFARRDQREERVHRNRYDQLNEGPVSARVSLAQQLGVKGSYADMTLPYHDRVATLAIDGMHTIRNVTVNILNAIRGKLVDVPSLTLANSLLQVADERLAGLVIPSWVDMRVQKSVITNPIAMKTHDYKQLVHQRILQYLFRGLFDREVEKVVYELLDCMGRLYSEEIDTSNTSIRDRLITAIVSFEQMFPRLMVS